MRPAHANDTDHDSRSIVATACAGRHAGLASRSDRPRDTHPSRRRLTSRSKCRPALEYPTRDETTCDAAHGSLWTRLSPVEHIPIPMSVINIHAAKTQLSRLVDAAAAGEEIVIARAGKPVARLVPFTAPRAPDAPAAGHPCPAVGAGCTGTPGSQHPRPA